ncbi:MAG: NAD(P)/FAD-dependent oxidoreductase [Acidobacteria bacterium]|nr:NAD(P)/FAD-dependent oxidoreductase [Acidobacteriota bacterium]
MRLESSRPPDGRFALSRRGFLLAAGAAAGYGVYRGLRADIPSSQARARVVIVGAGSAGLAVAARLSRALAHPDITLIEPGETHYYQPGFTLVAAGIFQASFVVRPQTEFIPDGVRWLRDRVVEADPDHQRVVTASNGAVPYDFLVLCPGLQMNFQAIEGIQRDRLGEGNVHCIYDYQSAQKCWPAIRKLAATGGRAVFSDTWTKLKCGGAPKKINLLAEDYCRRQGTRSRVDFRFYSALDHLFDVPIFQHRLKQIYDERQIPVALEHRIQSVDTQARKAVFRVMRAAAGAEPSTLTVDYDFLHIVPPMSAPDFVRNSALARDPATNRNEDWVPADKSTLVHKVYRNVVVLGDVAGLPTSKTGAAIRIQAPVAAANLIALMEGQEPRRQYNGYTACPVVTEYGKVLFAEFGYDKKPTPTLPFLDPGREHSAGWLLKVHVLRPMYFEGMLHGRV